MNVMNDESLIEAREKTKEMLSHFLTHWLMIIFCSLGALLLSWFGAIHVFSQVAELLAIINIFYFGVLCGCFVMYNIFWG